MVGTGMTTVTRRPWTRSRQRSGSNAGTVTVVAPSQTRPTSGATPATWNIAGAARKTSSPVSEQATILWKALERRLRWLSMTPLGRPVVPPV